MSGAGGEHDGMLERRAVHTVLVGARRGQLLYATTRPASNGPAPFGRTYVACAGGWRGCHAASEAEVPVTTGCTCVPSYADAWISPPVLAVE